MKLLPYSQLPFFNEMIAVIRKNQIISWQANDFWKKVQRQFDVEKTNINYQNIYRFVLRLERGNFLIIDPNKNEMGCTTYSETMNMKEFRELFCPIENLHIYKLEDHCLILKNQLQILTDQIEAIDELKKELPLFVIELNNTYISKMKEFNKLKIKLDVLNHMITNKQQNSKV